MGKVFIVQEPMRRNKDTGQLESMMDFHMASEYGDPVVCLSSPRVALTPGPMIQSLNKVLKDFSDEDYLICVGDPSAIAVAASICAKNNLGRYKLLKWVRDTRSYIKVDINLNV